MVRWRYFASTVLLFILVACLGAWAQGAGDLTGVVTDSTGAVVSKAAVVLTNDSTGITRTTETSAAGIYRFASLPVVGTYTMRVDATGFKAVSVRDIVISVGDTVTKDIALQVGATTELVNVEAGAQMVQTTESSVSQLVDSNVWKNMPLETRNQNEFINLVAGVTPDSVGGSTRGAAVNGARGGAGNYLVEGLDNNDQGQGGRGALADAPGGAITGISPEAIQEYRVITNSFSAEYGKSGGFVTDTVLKSGTNQWHGSLFEYNRVQALAANHYFSNRAGQEDRLVRNQFGASIGGPIVQNKSFFYASYEGHLKRSSAPVTATSTTQQFLDWVDSGGFQNFMESDPSGLCMLNNGSACPGAFANSSGVGPIFRQLQSSSGFPLATSNFRNEAESLYTGDALGLGLVPLTYPVPVYGDVTVINPEKLNENRVTLKVDHNLSKNDTVSGVYLFQDADTGDRFSGGDTTIGPAFLNPARSQNLGVSWNHTFSPTLLNVYKMSYLRHRSDFPNAAGLEGIPSIYTGFDSIAVGFGNGSSLPQFFTDNQFQFQDHLIVQHGKHTFKTGAEYRRTRNGSSFEADKYGEFAPYGIEDLVTDLNFGDGADQAIFGEPQFGSAYYAIASVDPTTGKRPVYYRGYRANEFAAYLQDDWRVSQRLTINLGLRWEYFGVPHNFQSGIDSNYYFGSPVTPIPVTSTNPYYPANNPLAAMVYTGSFQQRDHEIWNKDTNNFGPRAGFAFDVLGNQKLVLRGGAAITYDRIWNNLFENIRFNAPYFSFANIGALLTGTPVGATSSPGLYTVPFTETQTAAFNDPAFSPTPSPRHMDQNLVTPYYEQFHLGFQYEVMNGYVLETNYVGTLGHKLTGVVDINTYNGRTACSSSSPRSVCVDAGFPSGFSSRRVTTTIAGDNFRTNGFSSNYHALQVTFRKNFDRGFSFNTNYTWSKALDYISDAFNSRLGLRPMDNSNPKLDYGRADFDLRHRWVGSFTWELPWRKQDRWLGGWSFSSIVSLQTGVPFSVISSTDLNRDGYSTDRVSYVGSGNDPNDAKTGDNWADGLLDRNMFAVPTCPTSENSGLWCNAGWGRNSITGPDYKNVDFSVDKKFRITEGSSLTFKASFFNLFNRANFALPPAARRSISAGSSFGQSTETFDPRVTQLALRFDF